MSGTGHDAIASDVREDVRAHYAEAARNVLERKVSTGCCEPNCGCSDGAFGAELYQLTDRDALPDAAVLASLGCGNPTAVAELREGETVLDLGSGGGIDVLLSATRVGPSGTVYGLDMTDEMLELARANATAAGAANVHFLKGFMEDVPLPDDSVDVIISNCVVNLSTEKQRVFAEMRRVLRRGGRLGISDVVAADELSPEERAERGNFVGCVASALSFGEYRDGLVREGFVGVEVEPTHAVADGIFGAIVRARKA